MRRVIIEQIPWLYTCCDSNITAEDIASASRFQNERRRTEHLAWRRVVRRELGRNVRISYDSVGAPRVDVENIHLSVAHGAGYVAIALSDERVGVDIEALDRNFGRVGSRIMSEEERLLSSDKNWGAMVWSSKEALYKLYGKEGLDLCYDIHILNYDSDTRQLRASIENRRAIVEVAIHNEDSVVALAYFEK